MAYIGRDLRTGAFRQLDDISSGFDGSDTTHTMQVNSTNVSVGDVNQILLSLGGVIQKPGTDFTVSGSTLTFTTAPAANTNFFAILLGSDNGGTVTPTDGSVTSSKLAYPFVVNEDGADNDFRVETSGNANMFLVDGGNDAVIFNGSTSNFASGSQAVQVYNSGVSFTSGYGIQGGANADRASVNLTSGASGHIVFKTNNSEVARFTTDGLAIGGTGAANTLDDYEEGDFQVTTTYAGSGSWGLNTSNDTLHYVKVGTLVHIMGQIKVNAYSSASGIGYIDLPFAQGAQTEDADTGTGEVQVLGASQNSNVFCINVYSGLARLYFDRHDTTSLANAALAQFDSNMAINISISYHTA
jgi:hypothetical protein